MHAYLRAAVSEDHLRASEVFRRGFAAHHVDAVVQVKRRHSVNRQLLATCVRPPG